MNTTRRSFLSHLALGLSSIVPASSVVLAQVADPGQRPRNPALIPIEDQPGLPRVLLIGDSISIDYTLAVRALLEGVANVHRIPANGESTVRGLEHLDEWLGSKPWDVIHFNWGLHDLKLSPSGTRIVSPERYESNLRELAIRLKRTGAHLIFATTTPVPRAVRGVARDPADPPRYNEVAHRVMLELDIPINDLHAFVQSQPGDLQIPRNVHFTPEGSKVIARPIADAIRAALKTRAAKRD